MTTHPIIRPARPEDCDAIADSVRRLAADTASPTVPRISGATLKAEAFGPHPHVHLWVADAGDRLAGILIGVRTLSTWRDAAGLYVCDLWVDGSYRGARLGEQLLAEAARAAPALGLGFMKLEVAAQNVDAMRFYRRLGFRALESDTLWVLERAAFERLGS